ncbi:MAG: T9SS type A sorting domain-containing protein [Salinivirgaceae bacterium]|jgi:hypothetical protein|nr:T9SS type A sorting domain-containing protein [Salinivirgaceae bacterium]
MKQNYLFAPVIILVILIASFLGSYAYGQSISEDVKVIKVKKQIKPDDNSIEVIVKTIQILEDGKMERIEEFGDIDGLEDSIDKKIEVMLDGLENDLIFIGDDGEHIKIERKGEMVFINKEHDIKNVDSLLDVIEDENGNKVIIVQTRIVLDELTENDINGFKSKALKSGIKEPEFEFVKFYPNPTTDGIHVNFKLSEPGNTSVKISNMVGQVVFEEKLRDFNSEYSRNIQLKEHGLGPFILQILQGKRVISRKIMIE